MVFARSQATEPTHIRRPDDETAGSFKVPPAKKMAGKSNLMPTLSQGTQRTNPETMLQEAAAVIRAMRGYVPSGDKVVEAADQILRTLQPVRNQDAS